MAIDNPRDIPDLLFWFSAQHESTRYANNATVTQLQDLSGKHNHSTAVNDTPTMLATGGPGGGPGIQFNAIAEGFNLPNFMAGKAAGEMLAVMKSSSMTTEHGFMNFGNHAGVNHMPHSDSHILTGWGSDARKDCGVAIADLSTAFRRIGIHSASNDWGIRVDGASQFTTASNTVSWRNPPLFGQWANMAPPAQVYGLFVVYGRKLTTTERADLEAWATANPNGGTPAKTYSDQVMSDSPLAYWRLGEASGATAADSSGNSRHAAIVGTPAAYKSSGADSFGDGALTLDADSFVEVTSTTFLDGLTSITMEGWVKTTDAGSMSLFGRTASAAHTFVDYLNTNSLRWYAAGLSLGSLSATVNLRDGAWHHVVATWDGSTQRLYVDGSEVASGASTGTLQTTGDFQIGRRFDDVSTVAQASDEVAVYSTALSAAKVKEHFRSSKLSAWAYAALGKGATIAMDLDEPSAPWVNSAAPATDATAVNTPVAGQTGLFASSAGSVLIDAPGDAINTQVATTPLTNISVELRLKTNSTQNNVTMMSNRSAPGWKLGLGSAPVGGGSAGMVHWGVTGDGVWNGLSTDMLVNDNIPHHIVATYKYPGTGAIQPVDMKVYVDGVQVATTNRSYNTVTPPLTNSGIWGTPTNGDAATGNYEGVAVYPNKELTAEDVSELYNAAVGSASGQNVNVGLVTEVDVAQPIGINLGVNQVVEDDIAQPITVAREPDDFVMARAILGESGSFTHDMTTHTLETGEPNPNSATKTSWFAWTAPDMLNGLMQRFRTTGSNADTTLAIFTGTTLGSLVQVTAEDNTVLDNDADVEFLVTGGQTYYIQVGVKGAGPYDQVILSWLLAEPPYYDVFANPLVLETDYGSEEFTLTNTTTEPSEPFPLGTAGTAWLSWTAADSEDVTFTFRNIDLKTYTVTVYTGSTLGGLSTVTSVTGVGIQSVTFTATSGTQYRIQVSMADPTGAGFQVDWATVPTPVPPEPLPYPYPIPAHQSTAPMVRLRAEVYLPDGVTKITEVPRRMGVQFQEPLNMTGSGSMKVHLQDDVIKAYPDLLNFRNIVKFWLGTKCVHAFIIKRRRTEYAKSGNSGFIMEVSGPSVQYLLSDFIVKHDGNPRPDSPDVRYYSWASKKGEWYDAADWNDQVNQWTQSNPPSNRKKNKPKKWRVQNSNWININAAKATRYFRKEWTNGVEGRLVRIMATADEWWNVYLDGELILSDDAREIGYTRFKSVDVVLSKGTHTFAAAARSFASAKGDGNDSFMFAMCELDLDGKIIKPALLVSNNSWVGHKGDPPPGWNRAQVLRDVVNEAKARGVESADRLTLGFTGTTDSAGVAWPAVNFNQEVRIGSSALDLQAQLSEGNGFDVWVRPSDLQVRAWVRRGSDKSASVTIEAGRNIIDWEVDEVDDVVNDWLIKYDGGWTSYDAQGSKVDYGTTEAYVSLGNIKDENSAQKLIGRAARGIAKAQQRAGTGEIRKRPSAQPEGGVIGVEGAYPFLDYNTGDTVKAPNAKGVLVPVRVLSLSCTEDANGYLSFDPDVEEIKSE